MDTSGAAHTRCYTSRLTSSLLPPTYIEMAKQNCGQASSLGLVAFGVTTTVIMFNGLYPQYGGDYAQLMCWLGGYLQVIAGVLQLYREDCFSGTAFAAYGCFWVANANGAGSPTFLIVYGVLTTGFAVISLKHTPAIIALFTALAVAFYVLGFASGGPKLPSTNPGLSRAGHWIGYWVGLLAIYIAFNPLFESTYGFNLPFCSEVRLHSSTPPPPPALPTFTYPTPPPTPTPTIHSHGRGRFYPVLVETKGESVVQRCVRSAQGDFAWWFLLCRCKHHWANSRAMYASTRQPGYGLIRLP